MELLDYLCIDAQVGRLMHIHELAALPLCIIQVLRAISGCPISYHVYGIYLSVPDCTHA